MEAGHKDLGVFIYAEMHIFGTDQGNKAGSHRSKSTTSASSPNSSASNSAHTSPSLAAKRLHSSDPSVK